MSIVKVVRRHQKMENSICPARGSPPLTNKLDYLSKFRALDKKDRKRVVDLMSLSLLDKAIVNPYTYRYKDGFASFNSELEISADTYFKARDTAEQIFIDQKLERMADTGDKGNRNKRKFMSECSRDPPSTLTEFPRYEVLEEKFLQAMGKLESCEDLSGQTNKLGLHSSPEGKDPMITQLQEILKNSLTLIYHEAISKIIEHGYSKEIAERAALRSGPYLGKGDNLSNIVDGALDLLERNKEFDTSKRRMFEDLDNLVEYTTLEMTCMLREVNPSLSVVDAMWCLLIYDMNLPLACAVQKAPHKFCKECKPDLTALSRQLVSELEKNEKESEVSVQVEAALKAGIARKGCVHTLKSDLLRQKTFQFEKNHKGFTSKGEFKSKLTSLGPLVNSKNSSKQIPEAESKVPIGMSQEKEKSAKKSQDNTASLPKTAEYYCASIPYDKSQGKYVAQTEKHEKILTLVSRMQDLQKEAQQWKDWANEKIMQAADKCRKDQAEIKTLRLEKEEAEKVKLEKILPMEADVKKLSEMENALASAKRAKELLDSTVLKVKAENSFLRKEDADAKEKGLQEAEKLEKAKLREKDALKKCQLNEIEKDLMLDELKTLRKETVSLQPIIEKTKAVLNQIEVQIAHKEREKKKILKEAESMRKDRERFEAEKKAEEEKLKEKAKTEMQKREDEITKMEKKLLELKLETEARKTAELRISTSLQQRPKVKNSGGSSLNHEHECVMCLAEEKSVVFLPCGHMVLCVDCNEIHEKKEMNDCPSCRTPIQKRVIARFCKGVGS